MIARVSYWSVMVTALAAGFGLSGGAVAAEEGTVTVMSPWQGSGQVYQVGPEKLMILSRYAGIMYIENEQGSLDTAIMLCPGVETVHVKPEKVEGRGHCIISDGKDNLVFSDWTCSGTLDGCQGDFKITGGTGEFEGISGGGKMQVRTALVETALDLSSGSVVQDAAGLAVWPELKYKIPGE